MADFTSASSADDARGSHIPYRPQGDGPHPTLAGNILDPSVSADGKMAHGEGVGGTSESRIKQEGLEHLNRNTDDPSYSSSTAGPSAGTTAGTTAGQTSGFGHQMDTSPASAAQPSSSELGSENAAGGAFAGNDGGVTGSSDTTGQADTQKTILSSVKDYLGFGSTSTSTTGEQSGLASTADDRAGATPAYGSSTSSARDTSALDQDTPAAYARDSSALGQDASATSVRDTSALGQDTPSSYARDSSTMGQDSTQGTSSTGRAGEYAAGGAAAAGAAAAGTAAAVTGSESARETAEQQDLRAKENLGTSATGHADNRDVAAGDSTANTEDAGLSDEKKLAHENKNAATRENKSAIPTAGGERLGEKHWGESKVVADNPRPQQDSSAGVASSEGQPTKEVRDNTSRNAGGATDHGHGAHGTADHEKESMVDKLKDKMHMGGHK